jgi:spermidine synthase
MTVLERAWLSRQVTDPRDRPAIRELQRRTHHEVKLLLLDRLVHSYVDLDDPTWLGYDYERLYARILERVAPGERPVRCYFLGGGGYAFQRHLLATRGTDLSIVTAEIDPLVTRAAFEHLGLQEDPRHEIVHEDARTWLEARPADAKPFDLVFGDAFNDLAVPFHLTTHEFNEALAARMAPDGVYMINVIDAYASLRFVSAFANTLEASFEHVHVFSTGARLERGRDTFVLLATNGTWHLEGLGAAPDDPLRVHRYDEATRARWRGAHGTRILTDDHAPVESLLAPVVRWQED